MKISLLNLLLIVTVAALSTSLVFERAPTVFFIEPSFSGTGGSYNDLDVFESSFWENKQLEPKLTFHEAYQISIQLCDQLEANKTIGFDGWEVRALAIQNTNYPEDTDHWGYEAQLIGRESVSKDEQTVCLLISTNGSFDFWSYDSTSDQLLSFLEDWVNEKPSDKSEETLTDILQTKKIAPNRDSVSNPKDDPFNQPADNPIQRPVDDPFQRPSPQS